MGLDTVELVFATEAEFGISIPDEEAARIGTAGELLNCVLARVALRGGRIHGDQAWDRLVLLIAAQSGAQPAQIRRETHLIHDLGLD